jgi:hypothetical protein
VFKVLVASSQASFDLRYDYLMFKY